MEPNWKMKHSNTESRQAGIAFRVWLLLRKHDLVWELLLDNRSWGQYGQLGWTSWTLLPNKSTLSNREFWSNRFIYMQYWSQDLTSPMKTNLSAQSYRWPKTLIYFIWSKSSVPCLIAQKSGQYKHESQRLWPFKACFSWRSCEDANYSAHGRSGFITVCGRYMSPFWLSSCLYFEILQAPVTSAVLSSKSVRSSFRFQNNSSEKTRLFHMTPTSLRDCQVSAVTLAKTTWSDSRFAFRR